MKKNIAILAVIYSVFTANLMAQVPNYVPTNGLVGWWPFNGNANDESGNGNNGTVNGATLTTDRVGNANKAYSFDGVNDKIEMTPQGYSTTNFSSSVWINKSIFNGFGCIVGKSNWSDAQSEGFALAVNESIISSAIKGQTCNPGSGWNSTTVSKGNNFDNQWQHLVITYDGLNRKMYLNSILIQQSSVVNGSNNCIGGQIKVGAWWQSQPQWFNGRIDDIGIWNRTLSECEILDLYNSQLGSFKNTPINVNPPSSVIGTSAVFTSSKPLQTIQWQSNSNEIGWINLSNNGKYNGVTNDTLIVSNLQVSNHNQAFRAIGCNDTSNIAYIQITDTCITKVTKYDTITTKITKYDTIKVMDTLVINANLSGISAPNNTNRIIIYPNPAKDHITIDYGVFSRMSGYTMKITNTLGQTVFTSPINQQSSFINLSSWTGKGVYYLQIIDPNSNMIENRKIVLQ